MLICYCNILLRKGIEAAILRLLQADPWELIVPAKLYHSLGRRGRCCTCFPNVVEAISGVTKAFYARAEDEGEDVASHLQRVRGELRVRFGGNAQNRRDP